LNAGTVIGLLGGIGTIAGVIVTFYIFRRQSRLFAVAKAEADQVAREKSAEEKGANAVQGLGLLISSLQAENRDLNRKLDESDARTDRMLGIERALLATEKLRSEELEKEIKRLKIVIDAQATAARERDQP
jgi:hypothetical protein